MAVKNRDTQESHSPADTPPGFTDWRGEKAANTAEGSSDEDRLHQHTLAMGNWTEFYLWEYHPSDGWVVFDGDERWERLYDHHHDNWWKYREDVSVSASVDRRWKKNVIYAFAGEVEMNDLHREEAFNWLMKLDIPRTGLSVAENAFCICALIVNRDARQYGGGNVYHPQRKDENNDSAFLRLEQSLRQAYPRITKSSLTSLYNKLSQGRLKLRDPRTWKPYFRHEPLVPQDPDTQAQFTPEMEG